MENTTKSYDGEELNTDDMPELDLSGKEIVEMPGLDSSKPEDMEKFFAALKSGKIVRGNPFAGKFEKGYTYVVEHDNYDEVIKVKRSTRKRRPVKKAPAGAGTR